MGSIVNRYISDRRIRSNDAYTADGDGEGEKRQDHCVVPLVSTAVKGTKVYQLLLVVSKPAYVV